MKTVISNRFTEVVTYLQLVRCGNLKRVSKRMIFDVADIEYIFKKNIRILEFLLSQSSVQPNSSKSETKEYDKKNDNGHS